MDNVTGNIRYLLWKEKLEPRAWAERLARLIGCDEPRASGILRGMTPSPDELRALAKTAGVSARALKETDLVVDGKVSMLYENLACLIGGLEKGKKSKLAASLGIHPATISGWLSGKTRPERPSQAAICRYFRLPSGTDLEREPLFLSYPPMGETARKRWLKERIDQMDAGKLQEAFAAVDAVLSMQVK